MSNGSLNTITMRLTHTGIGFVFGDMNPMISSQNCNLQQSLVNCRNQCVCTKISLQNVHALGAIGIGLPKTVDVMLNTAAVNLARVAGRHRCTSCSGMSHDMNISLKSDSDLLYERVMKPLQNMADAEVSPYDITMMWQCIDTEKCSMCSAQAESGRRCWLAVIEV